MIPDYLITGESLPGAHAVAGNLRWMRCKRDSGAGLGLALIISLFILPGIAGAEVVRPFPNRCPGTMNIVADGGFEAVNSSRAACPCALPYPWVIDRFGSEGVTVQRGWSTEGEYAAVVNLDDSKTGEWILFSQDISGGRYCNLSFTYSMLLSGGRRSDLRVYMDNKEIWLAFETLQENQQQRNLVDLNVSEFSGNHTLKFQQRAFKGGIGHADWFIDDVRLMAGPVTDLDRPISVPQTGIATDLLSPTVKTEPATPQPVVTNAASFNPAQYLACLARRIHDELFPFIPLKEGIDPGCT
jgi:hypothetical protein